MVSRWPRRSACMNINSQCTTDSIYQSLSVRRPNDLPTPRPCEVSNGPPPFPLQGRAQPNNELNGLRLFALLKAKRLIEPGTSEVHSAIDKAIHLTVQAIHSATVGGAFHYSRQALSLLRASSSPQCRQAALQLETACSGISSGGASNKRLGVEVLAGWICSRLLKLTYAFGPNSHSESSPETTIIRTSDTLIHRLSDCETKDQIEHLLSIFFDLLKTGSAYPSDALTILEPELRGAMADCRTFNVERAGARAQASSTHQEPTEGGSPIRSQGRCRDIEAKDKKELTPRIDPKFSIGNVQLASGAMMKGIVPRHAGTSHPAESLIPAKVPKLSEDPRVAFWEARRRMGANGSTPQGDHTH